MLKWRNPVINDSVSRSEIYLGLYSISLNGLHFFAFRVCSKLGQL